MNLPYKKYIDRIGIIGLVLWLAMPMSAYAEVRPPANTLNIGNLVWNDTNNNGIADAGELGVGGVNLRLYDVSGTQFLANTYTDSLGQYQFSNLSAGQYIVELILPRGYVSSSGKNGSVNGPYEPAPESNNGVDRDDNGTFFSAEALRTAPIDLVNNAVNNTVDFGIYQPFSLGNRVWHDYNNNGLIDAADGSNPGIDEVQVQLWDMNRRVVIATTTTANGGYYRFDVLTAGDYVIEMPAANFTQGPLSYYLSSSVTESDANADLDNNNNGINTPYATSVGLRSGTITLGSDRAPREPVGEFDLSVGGQGTVIDQRANMTIDFGFFRTASIGDRVWMDTNANGTQDPDEKGLPGVTVVLNSQKFGSFTAVTDANGHYTFTNLIPSEQYQVIFSPLPGYMRSPYLAGGNDDFDSDADTTGQTRWVTPRGGEDITTLDAGFYVPGPVAATSTPLPPSPSLSPTPFPTFTPLPPESLRSGAASIEVAPLISPTPLPNADNVAPEIPSATPVAPAINEVLPEFSSSPTPTATPTQSATATIVPIESRASIGDRVWNDVNRNGVQDYGEKGLANVVVSAYSVDGDTLLSTQTDTNGNYLIAGLTPLTPYTISFQLPRGYTFTAANIRQDDLDSDADPYTGLIRGLMVWPGEINQTIDAGAYEIAPRPITPTATPLLTPTPRTSSPAAITAPPITTYIYPSPSSTAPASAQPPARAAATQPRAARPAPTALPQVRRPIIAQQRPAPASPVINGVRPPAPVIPPNAVVISPSNNSIRSILILQNP